MDMSRAVIWAGCDTSLEAGWLKPLSAFDAIEMRYVMQVSDQANSHRFVLIGSSSATRSEIRNPSVVA